MRGVGPSPRGRGNRARRKVLLLDEGSIPAWAGKPYLDRIERDAGVVHPRVGGETPGWRPAIPARRGPSPRGRGNRVQDNPQHADGGSIPAWAGKPWTSGALPASSAVHPRVGGETGHTEDGIPVHAGPSPRGRGNPSPPRHPVNATRSIPAWAGKPEQEAQQQERMRVHPRVGGETQKVDVDAWVHTGPSPRGRGNLFSATRVPGPGRSIPAWAGKPAPSRRTCRSSRVHPRVGGETVLDTVAERLVGGPSPRGRGNPVEDLVGNARKRSIPAWAGKPHSGSAGCWMMRVHPRVGGETCGIRCHTSRTKGPSPRGRGNPIGRPVQTPHIGSIPAWAGKPFRDAQARSTSRVHPRVGGETSGLRIWNAFELGPSPRGRGNLRLADLERLRAGSIPAWAGKPPSHGRRFVAHRVHPRVGGETNACQSAEGLEQGPSPRGRGNQLGRLLIPRLGRSIPAWAGKPETYQSTSPSSSVHPRVGGETWTWSYTTEWTMGPSPRGRGNRQRPLGVVVLVGSIPAWAGKPPAPCLP